MTGQPIELIVADIDGCLTGGGRSLVDLDMARRLRQWQLQAAEGDPAIPRLVFNTGRPLAYVLALVQTFDVRLPSLAECGLVMWIPEERRSALHPDYDERRRGLFRDLMADAEEEFMAGADSIVHFEAGKFSQLTLLAKDPHRSRDVAEAARDFLARWEEHFAAELTPAVLNLLPRGLHKGSGLDWLADVTGIAPERMAGIGDNLGDLEFMEKCGFSACPNNAREGVIARCDWVLDSGPAACMVELYERAIAHNRAVLPVHRS
ncbi:MAG: HAD hydrolase family protein [Sumerlaeia bacterium]